MPVVPCHQFRHRLRLVGRLRRRHGELHICDRVQELHVAVGEVPSQFPGGTGIGIGPVVLFPFGEGSENSFGNFNFTSQTIEHQRAIAQRKFGSGSRHNISPSGWGLTRKADEKTTSPAIRRALLYCKKIGSANRRSSHLSNPSSGYSEEQPYPPIVTRSPAAWLPPEPASARHSGPSSRRGRCRKTPFAKISSWGRSCRCPR